MPTKITFTTQSVTHLFCSKLVRNLVDIHFFATFVGGYNKIWQEMGIKVKLDLMLARRRMTLTQLSERIGITPANLSILKTGKGKAIRFSTLEAICHELNCQPGEILEFEED